MAYMHMIFLKTAHQTGANMHTSKYRHNAYTQTFKTFLEHTQSVSGSLKYS